jgi:hypothetical protein
VAKEGLTGDPHASVGCHESLEEGERIRSAPGEVARADELLVMGDIASAIGVLGWAT